MTMKSRLHSATLVLGVALSLALFACASTQKVETGSAAATPHEACFSSYLARSFSPLSERFVYVRVRSDEHYLLTLDAIYVALPHATGIKISETFSNICTGSTARLTFIDAGRPVTCRILRVEAVASKAEAERLVAERTTPKPSP
jgi:hypothetical protein